MDVKEYLVSFKKRFDPKLDAFLVRKKRQVNKLAPESTEMIQEIRRLNQAGGKRVRPAMIYVGFKACGGKNNKEAWNACIAMELIQAFALIHDDIMDDAQNRRGEITCFKKVGLDKAILVGDLALGLADELMPFKAKHYFDLMKQELIIGQWLDVGKDKNIFKIMELKTAMYTIARPLQIGAALAESSTKILKAFYEYGKNVGIAFQMKDDILDTENRLSNLKKHLKKAQEVSEQGKKAIKNVKIKKKEKKFLLDLADYVIARKN